MYNHIGPGVLGTGVVGGALATTGFDALLWAVLAALLVILGAALVRLGLVARSKHNPS